MFCELTGSSAVTKAAIAKTQTVTVSIMVVDMLILGLLVNVNPPLPTKGYKARIVYHLLDRSESVL